jgi:hypothetical protein
VRSPAQKRIPFGGNFNLLIKKSHQPGARSASRERFLNNMQAERDDSMKRFVFASALTALFLLVFSGPLAAAEVSFKGTLAGSFTATNDPPPAINRDLEAEGHATLLGDFTYDFPHTVDRSVIPSTAVGFATFTAANGDQVFAYVTGTATLVAPGVLAVVEHGTIVGGTGRFTGATGSYEVERLIDAVNPTTVGEFEGTISTPTPGKK